MPDLEELTLKLDADGDGTYEREYGIYPIDSVELSSTKEAFSIAPPGLAASDNILLGISGMNADITIQSWVWDASSNSRITDPDRANGTHTSTVTTIEEQITYLEDVMHDPGFTASWQLDHATGNAFSNDEVFVENIDVTVLGAESRRWRPVSFRLRRGGSV